jgi:Niemann-Pick C1 protein
MPAVRAFALYAAASLLINFMMQVTAFIALLALNDAREKSARYDVLCCIKTKETDTLVQSRGLHLIFIEDCFPLIFFITFITSVDKIIYF